MKLKTIFDDVRQFHEACGVTFPSKPAFPDAAETILSTDLVAEEIYELADALEKEDIVEVADAIGDSIVVLIRMALKFGIPIERVWDEIHLSNMAKVDPVTGFVKRREDGKILKPEGWTPPDIKGALGLS